MIFPSGLVAAAHAADGDLLVLAEALNSWVAEAWERQVKALRPFVHCDD